MIKKPFQMMILVLILLMAACSNSAKPTDVTNEEGASENTEEGSTDVIKIGFISDATGLASSQGKPEMDTAEYLEAKINEDGGINGKKVKLIKYDSESDETSAVLGMKKLINQNVSIVVGGTITGSSLAILEIAQKEKVPYISLAAGSEIVKPVKEYVFKVVHNSDLMIEQTLKSLNENNIQKVAWMNINDAYGEDGYKHFKEMAPDYGVEIIAEEIFEGSDTSVIPQLSKIKLKKPDAIVVWTRPPSGSVVSKDFKQLGFNIPLVHSYGMANQAYLDQAGAIANGNLLASGKILISENLPDSDPQKKIIEDFIKDHKEKLGYPPTNFSGYSYDGIMLGIEAIKNVGTDRNAIRDYIENNIKDFVGITGVFNITPEDHSGLSLDSIVMIEVKDGNWALYNK
ncbi:ABC transporter substrate-binding protein [Cytobacillus depressus]|uniref:ABC transporter substrate-binding protein n=1 Tax=Cytobacillus depressus TaxID=1602942 RepID=A0A6L3V2M6_9BACI|nr:ABC transporter substrate-binding protein [Cytobacillus depressus]KAB2330477.1 ABC transporter substrate-binding protein [Cytobacillus depressus]